MRSPRSRLVAVAPVVAGVTGLLLLALVGPTPAGESNQTISFQARITQDGVPLTADLDLTFQIYTAQSGGAKLWEETHSSVPVRNGILSVRLGDTVSLTNVFNVTLPSNSDRWVAVRVGGSSGTEIVVPRIKLTAVPYSMSAAIATIASQLDDGSGTGLDIASLDSRFGVAGGQAGGQALIGGVNANDDLTLQSTSDNTRGFVVVNDPLKLEELALLKQRASTPASVSTNYTAVYAKTDGKVYYLPSGGAETLFGSGAGGAGGGFERLSVDTTTVGNVGGGQDVLMSYSLPAGKLSATGDEVVIRTRLTLDGNPITVRVEFGSTSRAIANSSNWGGGPWTVELETRVYRTGATSQLMVTRFFDNVAGNAVVMYTDTPSETLSGAVTIRLTGESHSSSDDEVQQHTMTVDYIPNSGGGGGSSSAGTVLPGVSHGRLTLSSTSSVTTSDTTSDTLYLLPHNGSHVALHDGSDWNYHSFSSISATTSSLSTGKNYDVFAYDESGVQLRLEAWETDTARFVATDITKHDGVWVKAGDPSLRYLGTVRTVTSSGVKFRDSAAERLVWNYSNRAARKMQRLTSSSSWTYATNTWRQADGSSDNQVEFVIGVSEDEVVASLMAMSAQTGTLRRASAIGLDSTTAPAADSTVGSNENTRTSTGGAQYNGYPGIGYHRLTWLERSEAAGTSTWYGDNSGLPTKSGLRGTVWG